MLVPIDFSPGSREALREAVRLATACGAELYVQTVIEQREVNSLSFLMRGDDVEAHLIARFTEALERALHDAGAETCTAHRIVTLGVPFSEVLEAGARVGADLVVIASRGSGPFDAILPLASTTYRVVRQAPCSVYCVPPGEEAPAQGQETPPVLVPVDFGPPSLAAATLGAGIARCTGAPLALLCVVPAAGGPEEEQARARLGELAASLGAPEAAVQVAVGAPVPTILEVARTSGALPVVIGSGGPGRGLRSFLLGDTVYQVVRQLRRGVLVVKQGCG